MTTASRVHRLFALNTEVVKKITIIYIMFDMLYNKGTRKKE